VVIYQTNLGGGMGSPKGSETCLFMNGTNTFHNTELNKFYSYSNVSKLIVNRDYIHNNERYQFNLGLDPNSICGKHYYLCYIDKESVVQNLGDSIDHYTDSSLDLIIGLYNRNEMNTSLITFDCDQNKNNFDPVSDVTFVGKRDSKNLFIKIKSSHGVNH
jgi:hypothetical protein